MSRNNQDPTGQGINRRKGTRVLVRKLKESEKTIKSLFRSIPKTTRRQTKVQNAEQETVYEYEFNPQDKQIFAESVSFILNNNLLETQTNQMPIRWYWKDNIELPYRQGTVEEVRDFNQAVIFATIAGAFATRIPPQPIQPETVLISEPYRATLSSVQVENFNTIKTLSDRTASQVIQTINDGIDSGKSPRVIAGAITDRFNVAQSSAKRIADTEINKAYNNAKLNSGKEIAKQTGLRTGVVHISALLPTTRSDHAARHGNAYTIEDQLQWWNTGANRINCHCTTQSVLIDNRGNVINIELQEEIKQEGSEFFG